MFLKSFCKSLSNSSTSLTKSAKETLFSKLIWQSMRNLVLVTTIFVVFLSLFSFSNLGVFAQTTTNSIDLKISKVTVNGKSFDNKLTSKNNWTFDEALLGDGDSIRYSWVNSILDTKNRQVPILAGGFLKIYLNDDSKEENLLLEYGVSPLPLNLFSARLSPGNNKLLFVYINHTNKPEGANTKVAFNFKYNPSTNKPKITVLEPTENAVFRKDSPKNFNIQLDNFTLGENANGNPAIGKLKVYANTIRDENLLGTFKTSKEIGPSAQVVEFNSDNLDKVKFQNLADSKDTKLIFVLAKTSGENLEIISEKKITTNFKETLKIESPKVTILEPRKDRTNLNVDGNTTFLLKVENFETLKERQSGGNEENKGYLQIFVNNQPIKTIWSKAESFTLNEIGYKDDREGKREVLVRLVNKDFVKFVPEVSDTLSVIYEPPVKTVNTLKTENNDQPENSTLRIIVVSLILILFIGGIGILITKG